MQTFFDHTANLARVLEQDNAGTEAACARLCTEFANALDAGEYQRLLQVFAPDAVIVSPSGEAVRGHTAILASLNARPLMVTRHCCSNLQVVDHGDGSASGSSYVVCFKSFAAGVPGKPMGTPLPIVADYHDKYVRTVAGWRIQERRVVMVFDPQQATG